MKYFRFRFRFGFRFACDLAGEVQALRRGRMVNGQCSMFNGQCSMTLQRYDSGIAVLECFAKFPKKFSQCDFVTCDFVTISTFPCAERLHYKGYYYIYIIIKFYSNYFSHFPQ